MTTLNTGDHSRDVAGLDYVYPVISRRSGGLSIGINLNTNKACNWRCLYCQVPNLTRGGPDPINLLQLQEELELFLKACESGAMAKHFGLNPEEAVIRDIAISGNGEPTSAKELGAVIQILNQAARDFDLLGKIKFVLITNGSLIHLDHTQTALNAWNKMGGEVWVKLDSATLSGCQQINGIHRQPEAALRNIKTCAGLCKTWIQTCLFQIDGIPPSREEQKAYITLLEQLVFAKTPLAGVLLYGLARPSQQPEAERLTPLSSEWIEMLASEIRQIGLSTQVHL
jgi:wyosine [tRNA(Phe)-imidazoG37] synthetase (radical SAM superfamily)